MTGGTPQATGSLDAALAQAARLLPGEPALAAEQASEILKAVPGHPVALLYLAAAYRLLGRSGDALGILVPLAEQQKDSAMTQYELGLACAAAGDGEAAVAALRRAVLMMPGLAAAWRALADHLYAMDDRAGADDAYAGYLKASVRDPRLMRAGAALCEQKIAVAEGLLREHLKEHPNDVAALRMLAEVAGRIGRYADAETLLRRCLELAPNFHAARHNLALVLHRQYKESESLRELDLLVGRDPDNPAYLNLRAAVLVRIGENPPALAIYERLVARYPRQPKLWLSLGHALKTAGRRDEAIDAYRSCIGLAPAFGEPWWSLANLKTFRFTGDDVATMRAQLDRDDLGAEDRLHFEFALGKALEDDGAWEESFRHYDQGNRLRRASKLYDPERTTEHVRRSRRLFTREFFAARAGHGCDAPDPIFIVGLPRSGSTLLEQILASHSAVEGTMELPDIVSMARQLGGRRSKTEGTRYPEILADLSADQCRALGERYLAQTRVQRKTAAPRFIDKMPNNFEHVGLIHLALPRARIIDARRHPLGCCFSGFKQHFARGQNFTYSLEHIGRYYRDYVELMAHFDAVLPGRVHRVFYESMIEDTEGEVRRLLAYCELPFEAGCLRFFENDRAVRTASSEQVRRPIFREGVDHWRHYEPWLGPLKAALGPVLDAYPRVPEF